MKPQLAEDADLSTLKFPTWAQPKIDGVRAMNMAGTLTGRSLDPFEGHGITRYFSQPHFRGLDGEMTLGSDPASTDRLCSATTGAMGRFKGVTEMADLHWWVFDWLAGTGLVYYQRYNFLQAVVAELNHPRVHLVPYEVVESLEQAVAVIAKHAAAGYEGTIFRNPYAELKEGRPTKGLQQLLRVKPWETAEIIVTGLTEGNANGNAAKTNTLGRTERSSAKAGLVPNEQVGSIQGRLLADVLHPVTKEVMFKKDLMINVSPGDMTIKQRKHFWANPDDILHHVVTFKHMAHGVKDVPRMPGYKSHRLPQDMS